MYTYTRDQGKADEHEGQAPVVLPCATHAYANGADTGTCRVANTDTCKGRAETRLRVSTVHESTEGCLKTLG